MVRVSGVCISSRFLRFSRAQNILFKIKCVLTQFFFHVVGQNGCSYCGVSFAGRISTPVDCVVSGRNPFCVYLHYQRRKLWFTGNVAARVEREARAGV